ncbi:MAG: Mut7-C RNAse domain-containing protein [Candidatus Eisenbacteria bacterium]
MKSARRVGEKLGQGGPGFLVDSTVERLARRLRFLGFDAVLDRSESTARLLVRARSEGRLLLTRRRAARGSEVAVAVFLESDNVTAQLRQVLAHCGCDAESAPRCTVCNEELVAVSRSHADGRVPEFVFRSQREFAFCPDCDRYYWKGTHWRQVQWTRTFLGSEEESSDRES